MEKRKLLGGIAWGMADWLKSVWSRMALSCLGSRDERLHRYNRNRNRNRKNSGRLLIFDPVKMIFSEIFFFKESDPPPEICFKILRWIRPEMVPHIPVTSSLWPLPVSFSRKWLTLVNLLKQSTVFHFERRLAIIKLLNWDYCINTNT